MHYVLRRKTDHDLYYCRDAAEGWAHSAKATILNDDEGLDLAGMSTKVVEVIELPHWPFATIERKYRELGDRASEMLNLQGDLRRARARSEDLQERLETAHEYIQDLERQLFASTRTDTVRSLDDTEIGLVLISSDENCISLTGTLYYEAPDEINVDIGPIRICFTIEQIADIYQESESMKMWIEVSAKKDTGE